MRSKHYLTFIAVLFLFTATPYTVLAVGMGGYVKFASGNMTLNAKSDENSSTFGNDREIEYEGEAGMGDIVGFGFVLDTAVAKNKLFNYRLNIGYEKATYDINSGNLKFSNFGDTSYSSSYLDDFELEMTRFVVDNTFGFGIFKNKKLRLWLGPQIRVAFVGGTGESRGLKTDLAAFGVGIGPVGGVNVHIAKNVTLAFDLGYRLTSYVGAMKEETSSSSLDSTFTMTDTEIFSNMAIIFRFGGDSFDKK